jgi:UDP-N-acetylmuramoylalanine--D-glutamate ligase
MKVSQEILQELSHQKILILGLAREGWSTYNFLRQHLPQKQLGLADKKNLLELKSKWKKVAKSDKNLKLHLGEEHLKALPQYDLVIKTPGIPSTLAPINQAVKDGVQLSSNLGLMLTIIQKWQQQNQQELKTKLEGKSDILLEPITIGVTGTKGKSTTASVIHHVLESAGLETILVGNIGTPALSKINQITSKTKLVMEMSSHQLADLKSSPDVAVIQRITSEHLDYYADTQAYVNSKKSITRYQKENQYIIYNSHWPKTQEVAQLSPGHHLHFQTKPNSDGLVYIKSQKLTFRDNSAEQTIIDTSAVPLLGQHNLINIMPSIIVAKLFGIKTDQIKQAISTFKSLPHRLELVAEKEGVKYYNDSLATMPEAAISALSVFADHPIILLAGGHERDQDFGPLAKKILEQKVKSLILFPPTGKRIWERVEEMSQKLDLSPPLYHHFVEEMPKAVQIANQEADSGDIVLLSPGAASFGCFESYKDRGQQFRQEVKSL